MKDNDITPQTRAIKNINFFRAQDLFKGLGGICLLLMWIPFVILMIKGIVGAFYNPSSEMVFGLPEEISLWVILTVSLGFGGFLLIIIGFIVEEVSNRRILREGQPAKAKILSFKDTGHRSNENPIVNFSLEVQSMDQGTFIVGVEKKVSIEKLPELKVGSMIEVKYLPGTKKVAVI